MKTKVLLFSLFAITLFAIGTVIATLFNTAPTGRDVILLFYVSTFFSVFGLFFFIFYGINYARFKAIPAWQSTMSSFRYSAMFGLLVLILILLSANSALNFAIGSTVVIGLFILELLWRRRGQVKLKL